MVEENMRLVRRLVQEVWNQGNLGLLEEIAVTSYVRHDPSWPEAIQGREAYQEYVTTVQNAFAGLRFTIEDLIAEGDKVVVRWTLTGSHQGVFLGVKPTGRQVTVTGVTIIRIENGLIAEGWDGYDALGLMQQLGVIP